MNEKISNFFRTATFPNGAILFLKLLGTGIFILLFAAMVVTKLQFDGFWNGFTLIIAVFSISMAMDAHNMAMERKGLREFGEFFPSRELDKIIFNEYLNRCKEMGRVPMVDESAKFTTVHKDSEVLRKLVINQCTIDENVAKRLFTCEYKYNGQIATATCETREMAICIAFLRSCDYKDVM